jgi:hypothetical protein
VAFTSSTTGVCTITPGGTLTFVTAGICTINADQAGSAAFLAAPRVSRSFTVNGPIDVPRLGNASARAQLLTGNGVMIAGVVFHGDTNKTVVVMARGPSLVPHGITNPLMNPKLQLVRSSDQSTVAINDDFGTAANLAALEASGFVPADAREAAILVELPPGGYTAIVSGADGGIGVAILEVFEVDRPDHPLINLSARAQVMTGNDVVIGGFVIQGTGPKTVALVARGPSLAAFGIANPLANPVLQLVRSSDQTTIASNDDWRTAANAAQLLASGFAPGDPLEAAILVTLDPGSYTVIMSGLGGTTGVGIMEIFDAGP